MSSRLPEVVVSVALTVLAAQSSGAEEGGGMPNLLPNPSFEELAPDGVQGWKSRAWQGQADAYWTVATPGRTGKQCVSIASEKGADAAWTARVAVEPNATYRLSGWIKTKDLRGAVGALLNIQNMQHVKTSGVNGTRDWTRVATVFRTGSTVDLEINCLFGGWGSSTGQAWYDDVVLERVTGAAAQPRATVSITAEAPRKEYSRMLFGGFIEHFHTQVYGGLFEPGSPLSDERGFRKDVIAALKELKLSVVRWPGGCFASGYHWKDGAGQKRKPTPDPVWGTEDPNTFGTAEFVEWCRRVGCEPYICTNAGNGTPEEMREWVEYCNQAEGPGAALRREDGSPLPLKVRYWSIGNENWGGHEIGASTPEKWGPLVRRSAELMRGADPSLKLLAAATPDRKWTLPLLKAAGEYLSYVAIHEYWLPCWGNNVTPEYLACMMHAEGPERTITRVIEVLDAAGVRGRIQIAFDEWNLRGWHHPGFPRKAVGDPRDPATAALIQAREKNALPAQYTLADALFTSSFLNACLRHSEDVGMANIAPIVNTRGPLFVHPQGVVKRTTFHVLAMYANLLAERVCPAEVSSPTLEHAGRGVAALDALATCAPDGKRWRLALINRQPVEALPCEVVLDGKRLEGTFRGTALAGDSPDAYNDVEHPQRVTPQPMKLTFAAGETLLPPHSLTILEVE